MRVRIIAFDFDGVITKRGEALKEDAWDHLGKHLDPREEELRGKFIASLKVAREHYGQGKAKGSRYDIIRDALLDAHGRGLDDLGARVETYAERYNRLVQTMVVEEGIYPETTEALTFLHERCRLFVNSATPTLAVAESIGRLGLTRFFVDVFGQPKTKLDNLRFIASQEKALPREILFVGDSSGDEKAAQEFGCPFIGVTNSWNKWATKPFPLISRLTEIASLL